MTRPALFLALLTLPLAACTQTAPSEGVPVAATFYPLAYVAERVGGGHVSVTQITPAGIEPHDYEPTPTELAVIYDAKVFLYNGQGLDPWAERVRPELERNGAFVVETTSAVTLLPAGTEEEHADGDEHAEEEHGHESTHDPHVWLDPVLMQTVVAQVRAALSNADPAHAQAYADNANAFVAELRQMNGEYADGLKACGLREIVTAHDAFHYLSQRYAFVVNAVSGLSPDEEPSPRRIAELADLVKAKGIGTIFFETLTSPALAETIARETGAEPAVLNPLEGLTPEDIAAGKDYLSVMRENLAALRTAMRCP